TEIAFIRGGSPGQAGDLWVMKADGSGQHALTTDGGYCCPAWQQLATESGGPTASPTPAAVMLDPGSEFDPAPAGTAPNLTADEALVKFAVDRLYKLPAGATSRLGSYTAP